MKIKDLTATHNIFFVYYIPEKHIYIKFPLNLDITSSNSNKDFYDKTCKFAIYINDFNIEMDPNLVSTLVFDHLISDYPDHWVLELMTVISL